MEDHAASEDGRPVLATARPARVFLIIAIALLLLKLLLVSQREMVPETDDAESYVRHSLDDLASVFGGYAGHAPGASLVMASARSLGIPYRIFMEVFLALAAFLFFRPLVGSMRLGFAAAAFSYGLLIFHPTLILGMDRAISETCQLLIVAGRRRRHHWICRGAPGEPSVVESRASHRLLRIRGDYAFGGGSDCLRRNGWCCAAINSSVSWSG